MKYLLVLPDAFVICVVFLILCYLITDRRRFRVERQFIAVRALFDDWMEQPLPRYRLRLSPQP